MTRVWSGTAGWTLYDTVVGLVASAVVLGSVWSVANVLGHRWEARRGRADSASAAGAVERAVGSALDGAGRGLWAAPDWGPVDVRAGRGPGGVAADTLWVARGEGPVWRHSALPCRAGVPNCIVLRVPPGLAAADTLRRGDLLASGTAGAGGSTRVLEVVEIVARTSDPCGADCAEPVAYVATPGPQGQVWTVAGSRLVPPAGMPIVRPGVPCPVPVLADGTRCYEERVLVPLARRDGSAVVETAPPDPRLEVLVADRSGAFGYPTTVRWVGRAGAVGGAPHPRSRRIRLSRFYVAFVAGRTAEGPLVRQRFARGGWEPPIPVATPLAGWGLDVQHAAGAGSPAAAWERGRGFNTAALDPDPANPNRIRLAEADGTPRLALGFSRGLHTLVGVWARFASPELRSDGRLRQVPGRIVRAVGADHAAPVIR